MSTSWRGNAWVARQRLGWGPSVPLANPRIGPYWLFTLPRRLWEREKTPRIYTLQFGTGFFATFNGVDAGQSRTGFITVEQDFALTGIGAQLLNNVGDPDLITWGGTLNAVSNCYLQVATDDIGPWFSKPLPLEHVAWWTPTWTPLAPRLLMQGSAVALTFINGSQNQLNVLLSLHGVEFR
jgi:hypothetical protein